MREQPLRYNCKNWRPENQHAADQGGRGRMFILADLHHPETGDFYRTARCAETFAGDANRYCAEKNGTPWPPVRKEEPEPCLVADPVPTTLSKPSFWWRLRSWLCGWDT